MSDKFIPNKTVMLSPEDDKKWAYSIGGLFLNFGGIEMISLRWVQHFSKDPLLHDLAVDMTFAKRLQLISSLMERSDLSPDAKNRAKELWAEISQISETRNKIAHHPIVFGDGQDGKPAMGIPDFKKMKGPGPHTVPLIQLSKIEGFALRLVQLENSLNLVLVESNSTAASQLASS